MNWKLKLLVQDLAGLTPPTAAIYTLAKTELLRSRAGEPGKWCQWYREHVTLLRRRAHVEARGSRGWCFDAGYTIAAPLLMGLSGSTGYFSGRAFSIRSSYNDTSFSLVGENLPRLRAALRSTPEDERRILALRAEPDAAGVLAKLRIAFLKRAWPPPLDIADNSLDFVISMGALEHYSPRDLALLFAEMIRVVRPGGALSHIVDHRDHCYHAQESIGPLNHLRYSDRTWNLIARPPFAYTNRMLRSDYLEMFATLPLKVVYAGWDPHGEFAVSQSDLNERFRGRTDVDYAALVSHFICVVEK
jgi:SAM-dependent methyltransferase